MDDKYSKIVSDLAMLRLLVGFLGEKPQFGWWDTNFLSKTSLQFMEINFPRSYLSAGCVSVSLAAQQVHDQFIGKNGVFHLFRFTPIEEEMIHSYLLESGPSPFISSIQDKDSALIRLKSLHDEIMDAPPGPIQVGTKEKMFAEFGLKEIAKHYSDAFTNGKKTYPYFR